MHDEGKTGYYCVCLCQARLTRQKDDVVLINDMKLYLNTLEELHTSIFNLIMSANNIGSSLNKLNMPESLQRVSIKKKNVIGWLQSV